MKVTEKKNKVKLTDLKEGMIYFVDILDKGKRKGLYKHDAFIEGKKSRTVVITEA